MLNALFTWWQDQMRDLLPASVRTHRRTWRRTLVVAIDSLQAPTANLHIRGRGRTRFVGQHRLDDPALRTIRNAARLARTSDITLCIPKDVVLQRNVVVPAVAEQGLQQLLQYEMDRFSPLPANELFWTARVQGRDMARNRLHVQLTMIPRLRLQAILQALAAVDLNPTCIETGLAPAGESTIPLTPSKLASRWPGPRFNAFAFSTCGVLMALAISLPFIGQSVAYARLDSEIAALRPQVSRAEALRRKLASNTTLNDVITSARKQAGTPLQVIAVLTDLMPNDTYLTSLSLRQRKANINGRSAAAARLIGTMAAHPFVHNPTFTAPVIRDETSGRDSFQIRVDIGS